MTIAIAALAAFLGVGTLLVGAAAGWRWELRPPVVAGVMAFGAGALIATLAYELVHQSNEVGGIWPVVAGFAAGALVYVGADAWVKRLAAKREQHRPEERNATAKRGGSSGGVAYAVGAVLDGVPEALVIGISAAIGGFPAAAVLSIGLSNVAEGLAGTVPLKKAGRPPRMVFGLWAGIVCIAVIAAVLGAALMAGASGEVRAVTLAFAAGALMAMVVNSMIPEAVNVDHWATGLIASTGFLTAFTVFELL
ncbi:ZIP family zinc transporter [Demequina sp. TTPB684]|uniref:ZIP family metal transporter n=1 Tax=unclassified Demequina TaxID=2620311 RepID=UPI001CF3FCE9|nr:MULTISPECIES: ZIP family zinc transporter [unclassified Demequina]MCB2413711.1 ZIP family zinc transporter [Demequina sp. TTPB684]UPU89616.1 ZIP family zinc transporter [Demequina sp. TMPB413]